MQRGSKSTSPLKACTATTALWIGARSSATPVPSRTISDLLCFATILQETSPFKPLDQTSHPFHYADSSSGLSDHTSPAICAQALVHWCEPGIPGSGRHDSQRRPPLPLRIDLSRGTAGAADVRATGRSVTIRQPHQRFVSHRHDDMKKGSSYARRTRQGGGHHHRPMCNRQPGRHHSDSTGYSVAQCA